MDSTPLTSFAYFNHIPVLLTQSVRLQSRQISVIQIEESVPTIFYFTGSGKTICLLNVTNTPSTDKAAQARTLN